MITTDIAPSAGTLGGGFFLGLITGYAIRKVIKIAAVIFGLFIAALALENNDKSIYNIIQRCFREGSNMKKEGDFAQMTVNQLKHSSNQINLLHAQLRNTMKPLTSPSNLSLPFDANRKIRMEALKRRIEQRDPSFKISDMKYKSKYGYYKSNNIEFPFFFETAVVYSNKIPSNLEFIDSLNLSVMPGHYSFLVGSDPQTFQYQTQADRKNNNIHTARSIFEIFEHYGYSYKKERCKKPHSLIIANLISPRIDYKSYGKSNIDLAPFAETIAEMTAKVCSGSSTTSRLSNSEDGDENSVIGFLRALLLERYEAVKKNPSLKDTQKWTQSTVFYLLRRILLDRGFSAERIDRQYITSEIREVCEKYLGVKREELGISAADRAQLYFK
jgi:FUN14 family protein